MLDYSVDWYSFIYLSVAHIIHIRTHIQFRSMDIYFTVFTPSYQISWVAFTKLSDGNSWLILVAGICQLFFFFFFPVYCLPDVSIDDISLLSLDLVITMLQLLPETFDEDCFRISVKQLWRFHQLNVCCIYFATIGITLSFKIPMKTCMLIYLPYSQLPLNLWSSESTALPIVWT